jgi:O-methyltransferase involved in polyketide biosynthesis
LEGGRIFNDPIACTILGKDAHAIIQEVASDPSKAPRRLFITARIRFAEDCLSAAVLRGVRQAVVLGRDWIRSPYAIRMHD